MEENKETNENIEEVEALEEVNRDVDETVKEDNQEETTTETVEKKKKKEVKVPAKKVVIAAIAAVVLFGAGFATSKMFHIGKGHDMRQEERMGHSESRGERLGYSGGRDGAFKGEETRPPMEIDTAISEEQAKQIVLDANKDASIQSIRLMQKTDQVFYSVRIKQADGTKTTVSVDADTGEILTNTK